MTTQPPTGGLNLSPTSIPTYQQNIFFLSLPFGSLHLHIVDADVVPPNSQCSHYASFSDDVRIRLVILKITDLISAVLQQCEYFSQLRRFNNRRGPLNFGVKKKTIEMRKLAMKKISKFLRKLLFLKAIESRLTYLEGSRNPNSQTMNGSQHILTVNRSSTLAAKTIPHLITGTSTA